MDKYLKMGDQFELPVYSFKRSSVSTKLMNCHGYEIEGFYNFDVAEYAAHAINSHDELVAEVDRLRSENQSLMKCRMAAREFFNCTVASGGSVKVSSANKAALYEADKASDWLEIELKATADLVKK